MHFWAHRAIYKPLVVYIDRRVQAFGGLRGLPFTSLSWHTWIVVYMPLVAYVDCRLQAFGCRWSDLQAFGGIRGSSFTSLLVAYVDRRVEAFGVIHGLSFARLCGLTWIAVHKLFVADGVNYKPLVAYVDRRVQAFWWRTWILVYKPSVAYVDRHSQAFGSLRGSPFTSIWRQIKPFTSLCWYTWIVVYKPLVADGVVCKPFVACVDPRS